LRTADSLAAAAGTVGVVVVAAGVDAAGRADGETGVGDVAVAVGASSAVATDAGSGFGMASVIFVGAAGGVVVSGTRRMETAAPGFGRTGTAAVRRGDERYDVEGRRLDATLVEVTVGSDDGFVAVAVGARTGDATIGVTLATSVGGIAALWSMDGDAGL
jgi:hypothetical protein